MTDIKIRLLVLGLLSCALANAADGKLGIFTAESDIGVTPQKGSAEFDSSTGEYRVTGGGDNMWKTVDAFHFVWKKMSGDFTLTAEVRFVGTGAVAHRKAALIVRQNLEPGSAYADVARHGDGLTSLQFRPTADVLTEAIRSDVNGECARDGGVFERQVRASRDGRSGALLTPVYPERIDREHIFLDRPSTNQVLLNNSLQNLRGRRVVPHAIRVHHSDGSILADAQAVGLRAVDDLLARGEAEIDEPPLEILPGGNVDLMRSALWLRLLRAQKNVAPDAADA